MSGLELRRARGDPAAYPGSLTQPPSVARCPLPTSGVWQCPRMMGLASQGGSGYWPCCCLVMSSPSMQKLPGVYFLRLVFELASGVAGALTANALRAGGTSPAGSSSEQGLRGLLCGWELEEGARCWASVTSQLGKCIAEGRSPVASLTASTPRSPPPPQAQRFSFPAGRDSCRHLPPEEESQAASRVK